MRTVKLDHSPIFGVKIKNYWSCHLEFLWHKKTSLLLTQLFVAFVSKGDTKKIQALHLNIQFHTFLGANRIDFFFTNQKKRSKKKQKKTFTKLQKAGDWILNFRFISHTKKNSNNNNNSNNTLTITPVPRTSQQDFRVFSSKRTGKKNVLKGIPTAGQFSVQLLGRKFP